MTHEWHGVRGTLHHGVFITEGDLPGEELGTISATIGRQNANLNQIKDRLATEAEQKGANAVASLQYGQRKHGPAELMNPFRWDTETWFGEGRAMKVPPAP
jgi:uncharacterized protein YbjQ (UPF0145 family)